MLTATRGLSAGVALVICITVFTMQALGFFASFTPMAYMP